MKVLITSNSHSLYVLVVTLTHRARMLSDVWVVEAPDGAVDYVREGEFRIVKRQEGS